MATGTLKGKSAIVTGSTSGIGLGIAQAFAKEGMNLTLNGFGDRTQIDQLVKSLSTEFGVKVEYSSADMSKPTEIREMVRRHETLFGQVDVLVNNAGIQNVAPVDEFPEEKWDAILAINLSSNFHTVKAALPGMKKAGWGRIINVASVHGLVASPYKSAYVAAKHGVLGFTKSIALELADTNITANAICPGYVRTPLVENQIEGQAAAHKLPREQVIREVILAAQPKKQFIEVEQLGAMAVYLCSSAADPITGTSFTIDGGWTAR
ncbi:MAG TPA: 3-hydroxybutyrate dehydrogenase [Bdellovibrionales bacterium]|nr:3-hydroxybutyrate dehydrogenase [Bdellovibrionales bacterium]